MFLKSFDSNFLSTAITPLFVSFEVVKIFRSTKIHVSTKSDLRIANGNGFAASSVHKHDNTALCHLRISWCRDLLTYRTKSHLHPSRYGWALKWKVSPIRHCRSIPRNSLILPFMWQQTRTNITNLPGYNLDIVLEYHNLPLVFCLHADETDFEIGYFCTSQISMSLTLEGVMLDKYNTDLAAWSAFSLPVIHQCGWGSSKRLHHSCHNVGDV